MWTEASRPRASRSRLGHRCAAPPPGRTRRGRAWSPARRRLPGARRSSRTLKAAILPSAKKEVRGLLVDFFHKFPFQRVAPKKMKHISVNFWNTFSKKSSEKYICNITLIKISDIIRNSFSIAEENSSNFANLLLSMSFDEIALKFAKKKEKPWTIAKSGIM